MISNKNKIDYHQILNYINKNPEQLYFSFISHNKQFYVFIFDKSKKGFNYILNIFNTIKNNNLENNNNNMIELIEEPYKLIGCHLLTNTFFWNDHVYQHIKQLLTLRNKKWAILNCKTNSNFLAFVSKKIMKGNYIILGD